MKNAAQFLSAVQGYYEGKYSPRDIAVLGPWIDSFESSRGNFALLFDCLTEVFSKTFGKLPDKARMVEAKKLLDERQYVDVNALPAPPDQKFIGLTRAEQTLADDAITSIVEFFASRGQTLRISLDQGSTSKSWELQTHKEPQQ